MLQYLEFGKSRGELTARLGVMAASTSAERDARVCTLDGQKSQKKMQVPLDPGKALFDIEAIGRGGNNRIGHARQYGGW